jgi:hypothetical protein
MVINNFSNPDCKMSLILSVFPLPLYLSYWYDFKRTPLRFFDLSGLEIFSETYVQMNAGLDQCVETLCHSISSFFYNYHFLLQMIQK